MSGDLRIQFGPGIPAVAVDVVAPDMSIVKRMMMAGGQTEVVPVPSEQSFLRIHLPSGKTVLLAEEGSLDRVVTLDSLTPHLLKARPLSGAPNTKGFRDPSSRAMESLASKREIREHYVWRSTSVAPHAPDEHEIRMEDGSVSLKDSAGLAQPGATIAQGREAYWDVSHWDTLSPSGTLIVLVRGREFKMTVPANTQRLWVRFDEHTKTGTDTCSVRLQSRAPVADTVLNYIHRGDMSSASVMSAWAQNSEALLLQKQSDPYGAAVGAYLLLKVGKHSLLHDWPQKLAEYEQLSDGNVIWATQLLRTEPSRARDIERYLLRAATGPLPTYTEGVRLLIEGLRLLDSAGVQPLAQVGEATGQILWDSPLTAHVKALDRIGLLNSVKFNVEFTSEL